MSKRRIALASLMTILVLALAFYVLEPVFSPGHNGKKFSGRGVIKSTGIGVYTNSTLSGVLSSINWGALEPGMMENSTCYVQNEGNTAVVLSLTTVNWNPSNAGQFISLEWNYTGAPIAPSQGIGVTFTLSVTGNPSGIADFSFGTVIASLSA